MLPFLLWLACTPGPAVAVEPAAAPLRCPTVPIGPDGSFTWPGGLAAADGRFDWPLSPPDGLGYYDVQPFGRNRHLGADLNDRAGKDSGAPVHAIADGCVVFAQDIWRGWGNVVRVVHVLPEGAVVESLYAHLDRVDVNVGQWVPRGLVLGTVGDAHHAYSPHLHLEVRDRVGMPQGHGYGEPAPRGYVDPMAFIAGHRAPADGATVSARGPQP
jgi:murein DD-endopeptidase MepM/ murein hydrolase activator NlpD